MDVDGAAAARDRYLQRTYGINQEQYDQILEVQNGKCAVCGGTRHTKPLHVDHDHKTGAIRGLLCFRCNRFVIGNTRAAELHAAAARYLTNPPANKVLGQV